MPPNDQVERPPSLAPQPMRTAESFGSRATRTLTLSRRRPKWMAELVVAIRYSAARGRNELFHCHLQKIGGQMNQEIGNVLRTAELEQFLTHLAVDRKGRGALDRGS